MEVKNLPERLRKSADYLRGLSPIDFSCEWVTCRGAADEIERLRAEIADAHALAYNSLPDRGNMEDTLCGQVQRLREEIERLRAIVDKSPKTADGVPITFESTLWVMHAGMLEAVSVFEVDDEFDVLTRLGWFPLHKVYSTREAAEAAKEK